MTDRPTRAHLSIGTVDDGRGWQWFTVDGQLGTGLEAAWSAIERRVRLRDGESSANEVTVYYHDWRIFLERIKTDDCQVQLKGDAVILVIGTYSDVRLIVSYGHWKRFERAVKHGDFDQVVSAPS
jgi:hypothetical protein